MKTNKKIFGVIGYPLGHSYSPSLHNFWIKKNKINAKYKKFEIKKNKLKKIINKIKTKEIVGLNVTTPHKTNVINLLDKIQGDAKITRSVNTILQKKGQTIGENTDVYGIEKTFLKKKKNLTNKTILILGAGGVVSSLILALKKNKAKKIILCNRSIKRIKKIRKLFKKNFQGVRWKDRNKFLPTGDIIFNATSLGMKNKPELNIDVNLVKKNAVYCDLIYNPVNTKTIKKFKKLKIKTINGLDMFIFQAEKSFLIWHKKKPVISPNIKRKIFKKIL